MSLEFNLSNLFHITTKKEREEQEKAFFERVFPFGEEQKKKVAEFLKNTVVTKRQDETICLFTYISLYDALTTDDQRKKDKKVNSWKKSSFIKYEDKLTIYALVLLNMEIENLEAFPEKDKVKEVAEKLRNEL